METEKKRQSSAYSSLQETLKKQADLLQNRPGISFIPATSVSIFSLAKAVFEARGRTRIPAILSQQQPKPFSGGLIGPSSPIVLLGVSGVFALSSYSISQDISNGPSTATAWCVAYLAMFGKSSLQSRRPAPIMLTSLVFASGIIYLREMLDVDVE